MNDDRKKPILPWIVALLIGLPVMYVASFGPACWRTSHVADQRLRSFDEELPIDAIFDPLLKVFWGDGWPRRGDFLDKYSRLCANENWRIGRRGCATRPNFSWSRSWYPGTP
jgi:hypothetical protein